MTIPKHIIIGIGLTLALSACSEADTPAPTPDQPAVYTARDTISADMTSGESVQLPELISAPEVYELSKTGQLTFIDIRTPREWRKTGVPEGAATINMRKNDFIDRVLAEVGGDKSTPIALSCGSGGRSSKSANTLREAGFTNIADVSEGFFGNNTAGPGWEARGLPVVAYAPE